MLVVSLHFTFFHIWYWFVRCRSMRYRYLAKSRTLIKNINNTVKIYQ